MRRAILGATIACAFGVLPCDAQPASSRILKLDELRFPQVQALDRERTMFVLPIGMLEEHGPHLPIGADTIGVMQETGEMMKRVSGRLPQWNVVMMPPVHYGETGANEIAGQLVHPGTYGIRHSTVRSLVADIGAQVAQNGFKWIFVLTGHGAPTHNLAVNDACDFVSETFGVNMLHISAIFRADPEMQARGRKIAAAHFSASDLQSFGMDVHAGVGETSAMLARRPDLVDPGYTKRPPVSAPTREEFAAIAKRPGWQGYFSSPAKATAAYGRDVEEWWIAGTTELVLRAVGGQNLLKAPRAPLADQTQLDVFRNALDNERVFEAKLDAWRARRKKQ